MKNSSLENTLKEILANPNVIVSKGQVGGHSIEVTSEIPIFEDLGSFIYYNKLSDRNKDYEELTQLIKENNVKK